ncbi:MAG TPA: sulfur carrier protein ThiS [Terriglobales bacterium]
MTIVLNGQPHETGAATCEALIAELGLAGQRVALERNQAMIPRRLWADTPLAAGDRIEVVQFVGGG